MRFEYNKQGNRVDIMTDYGKQIGVVTNIGSSVASEFGRETLNDARQFLYKQQLIHKTDDIVHELINLTNICEQIKPNDRPNLDPMFYILKGMREWANELKAYRPNS